MIRPWNHPREFTLRLDLPLMSKARPRCAKGGHAYMPPAYMEWKARCRDHLMHYWVDMDLPTLTQMELHVKAYGHGRSDPDNLIAALLDAGLPDKKTGWRGCWRDDRVTVCPVISFQWFKSREQYWEVSVRDCTLR